MRKQQARTLPGHAPFCGVRRRRGPAYPQAPPTCPSLERHGRGGHFPPAFPSSGHCFFPCWESGVGRPIAVRLLCSFFSQFLKEEKEGLSARLRCYGL